MTLWLLYFSLLIPFTSMNRFAYDVQFTHFLVGSWTIMTLCCFHFFGSEFECNSSYRRFLRELSHCSLHSEQVLFNWFSFSYSLITSLSLHLCDCWEVLYLWSLLLAFSPQIYWVWYPECPIRIVSRDAHISYWTRSSISFSFTRIYLRSSRDCTFSIFLIPL